MRPRVLLRIARWETFGGGSWIDRGAVAVALAAVAVILAGGAAAVSGSVTVEDGIYRVGIGSDSDLHEPVADDPAFRALDPQPVPAAVDAAPTPRPTGGETVLAAFETNGRLDLYVEERPGGRVVYLAATSGKPTDKSLAAAAALRESVREYNDRRMTAEDNVTAAFPVVVSLQFTERELDAFDTSDSGTGGTDGIDPTSLTPSDSDVGGNGDGVESGAPDDPEADGENDEEAVSSPGLGSFDLFGSEGGAGTPAEIQPPFPFQSLVLAFIFVLPLNFLIQAYGSSMLSERLDRRGELLLVAPVSPAEIVAGKTLPYLAASVAVTAGVVGGLRLFGASAGGISVLAVVPIALLFLGTTFLGAMFARSFKELTFLTIAITTTLTSYAFVPAIFAETSRVALVSPLSIVVWDLTEAGVSAAEFVVSAGPPTLAAASCFTLGLGLYCEEDLFTQRPVHLKGLDALSGRIVRPGSVAVVVALLVPFVFVSELLAVALLFALPIGISLPAIFVTVAVIEELAKGLPTYAGFVGGRLERTVATAGAAGVAAGVGFFLAEKVTLAVQLVGLPESAVAEAAFATGAGADPLAVAALALAPLMLHVGTAGVSALGGSRGRRGFVVGLTAAIAIHVAYNLAVVNSIV